jgi:hypothetical protein
VALLFHARYDLGAAGSALAHVSRTCAVAFARDMSGAKAAGDPGDEVALKFMADRPAFDREVPITPLMQWFITATPVPPHCTPTTPPLHPHYIPTAPSLHSYKSITSTPLMFSQVSFREVLDPLHFLRIKCTHGGGGGGGGGGGDGEFAEELHELVSKDKRFQREKLQTDADGAEHEQHQLQHGGGGAAVAARGGLPRPRLASMAGPRAPQDTAAYAYCVVMPKAERTLAEAVQHEHFAGQAGSCLLPFTDRNKS